MRDLSRLHKLNSDHFATPQDAVHVLSDALVQIIRTLHGPTITEQARRIALSRGILALGTLGLREEVSRALGVSS